MSQKGPKNAGSARFVVWVVGKPKVGWAQSAVDDYTHRMRRHGGVEERVVASELFRGDVEAVRTAESARLLGQITTGRLVVLDERGVDLDTRGFVGLVDAGRQAGTLHFALGGAYGHSAALRDGAWRVARLSSLVLNHELARVVLYEQLYRAMTLIDGVPYHH